MGSVAKDLPCHRVRPGLNPRQWRKKLLTLGQVARQGGKQERKKLHCWQPIHGRDICEGQ